MVFIPEKQSIDVKILMIPQLTDKWTDCSGACSELQQINHNNPHFSDLPWGESIDGFPHKASVLRKVFPSHYVIMIAYVHIELNYHATHVKHNAFPADLIVSRDFCINWNQVLDNQLHIKCSSKCIISKSNIHFEWNVFTYYMFSICIIPASCPTKCIALNTYL